MVSTVLGYLDILKNAIRILDPFGEIIYHSSLGVLLELQMLLEISQISMGIMHQPVPKAAKLDLRLGDV